MFWPHLHPWISNVHAEERFSPWRRGATSIPGSVMFTPRNAFHPGDVVLSLLSSEVHDQLLHFFILHLHLHLSHLADALIQSDLHAIYYFEGEVIFLVPLCQGSNLLPVGCLIIVCNHAYHCCIVCKLDNTVGDMIT
jgi:hypothetical protein